MIFSDDREILVNKIIMAVKEKEYQEGVDSNGKFFAASQHFFHSKDMIDKSIVFQIIKMLPKGKISTKLPKNFLKYLLAYNSWKVFIIFVGYYAKVPVCICMTLR